MRTTRISNIIPIGRWEMGEKWGEPKYGERKIFLQAKVVSKMQVFQEKNWNFGKPRKLSMDIDEENTNTKFIPIERWESGEK